MGNNRRQIAKTRVRRFLGDCKDYDEYDPRQIARIIKRYQQLKSAAEIASSRYERVSGGSGTGKEEILCTLIDIDRAMKQLSPRQRMVIGMLEQGYLNEEICSRLGIGMPTVKYHVQQGLVRLTSYLNAH